MPIGSLLSPAYWRGRAVDALWRWRAGCARADSLTWPLRQDVLAEVTVVWPAAYQWEPFRKWGEQLRAALARFVPTVVADVEQSYEGVITCLLAYRKKRFRINVEVSDYLNLNETAYDHCDLHFKMQYRLEGYGARDRLVPGGYLNNDPDIYAFLPRLRALRDAAPALYDVHGRFGLSFEARRRAIEILGGSSRFGFVGGQSTVRYGTFLREVARSRVGIDLPGYGPLAFRLVDYMAIGSCVIGPPHAARLHVPLEDRVQIVYCKPDYADLEELCAYYLAHEAERQRLVEASRQFFDRYLHRDQLAAYYLCEMGRLLG
jgi:hypothetical protein